MKLKIESIEYIDSEDKYDIEVENVHNFFANGILVHNCRCIATKDGMFSREGNRFFSAPHIHEALKGYFTQYPDAVLDGELYNHELRDDFNKILSLIKKKTPTDAQLAESAKLVQYYIYDTISDNPFSVRSKTVYEAVVSINSDVIIRVPTFKVDNADSLDLYYGDFLTDGYEGQMTRFDVPYEQTRSASLLKRKEFEDAEFPVSRIIEGLGNWSGVAKAVEFILPGDKRVEKGERPKAGIAGNKEFAKELLNSTMPKWVTVRYQNLTPDSIPRFPIAVAFYDEERDL